MHAGLVFSTLAHGEYNDLVMVVNNASGICLAASYPQTRMLDPMESEVRYLYLPSLDLVQSESQWFLADITRSPVYNK